MLNVIAEMPDSSRRNQACLVYLNVQNGVIYLPKPSGLLGASLTLPALSAFLWPHTSRLGTCLPGEATSYSPPTLPTRCPLLLDVLFVPLHHLTTHNLVSSRSTHPRPLHSPNSHFRQITINTLHLWHEQIRPSLGTLEGKSCASYTSGTIHHHHQPS